MSAVRRPRALRPGDRVAVVAPASPFSRDELEAGIGELAALGFEPVYDERVFARRGFVSGDPAVRAAALRDAWRDESIAAIVAVRGGYGSVQILPLLDFAELSATPKAFVGYSDLTSLLSCLVTRCGMVAFHGPMLAGRLAAGPARYDRDSFTRCLMRGDPPGELAAEGVETLRPGEAAGLLVGGTLTQLAASLGTPFAFDPPEGCVLFIDEVNERPYRIDRSLTQLRLAGVLRRVAAVVFGELPGCDEPGGGPAARGVVADLLRDFSGPVLFNFPSGHTTRPLVTLPLGVRARVMADGRPRLLIEEAAVETA